MIEIQLTHRTMDGAELCNVCIRPLRSPFRVVAKGIIVSGCISAAHDGHVFGADADWHWHPEATAARKEWASHLESIGISVAIDATAKGGAR